MGHMGDTAQIPANDPLLLDFFGSYNAQAYPEKLIKRCQVAQDSVSKRLMEMGIEVVRPGEIDH